VREAPGDETILEPDALKVRFAPDSDRIADIADSPAGAEPSLGMSRVWAPRHSSSKAKAKGATPTSDRDLAHAVSGGFRSSYFAV
jgi:hypothetical protein